MMIFFLKKWGFFPEAKFTNNTKVSSKWIVISPTELKTLLGKYVVQY